MYMTKLDIKHAYYSMPAHKSNKKLLEFAYHDELYNLIVISIEYTESPRKFTKTFTTLLAFVRVD